MHRLPSVVRTRVIPARGELGGGLERVSWLDPYSAETISASARRAGPGARLEVTVPKGTSAEGMSSVEKLFAWLREKGIEVTVRRSADET